MALRGFGQLFRTNSGLPLLQTVRHRTRKPNLRHPPIPHWQRAVILEVAKPQYKDPLESVPATCKNREKFLNQSLVKDNPFEVILAKELFKKVEESNFVAVFHCNPMTSAELFANRVQLSKVGLFYHHCNNKIAELAFSNTKYEAVLDLYKSRNATFIGTEVKVPRFACFGCSDSLISSRLSELLKILKRMRSLVLLAGVVEGRLMSLRDIERYAALPPLPVLHGQLVGILHSPLQQLSQNLTYHQTELSAALGRYISDQTKVPEKESQESAIEPDAS